MIDLVKGLPPSLMGTSLNSIPAGHFPDSSPLSRVQPLTLLNNVADITTSYLPLAAVTLILGIGIYIIAKPQVDELIEEAKKRLLGDPEVVREKSIQQMTSVLENYFWNAQEIASRFADDISERENQYIASGTRSESLEAAIHSLLTHHVRDLVQRENLSPRHLEQLLLRLQSNVREVEFVQDRFTERLKLTMKKNHPQMSVNRWIHTRQPLSHLPYARWYALIEMRALILREIFTRRFSASTDIQNEAIQLYYTLASTFTLNENDAKAGLEDLRRIAVDPSLHNLAEDVIQKLS